jgi:hypothetical protein
MFAMSIVHAVLIFLLIGVMSALAYWKRSAYLKYADADREPDTMGRASLKALGVLAAVPAAAIVSYLLGTLTASLVYATERVPGPFWDIIGLVLLAGGVPLVLFVIAREVIFAIGKVN